MEQRTISMSTPVDLALTLGRLRFGGIDPTHRFGRDEVWRATRTPEGPATLHLVARRGEVAARAWGAGAGWALETAPALIGYHDRPHAFVPLHPVLRDLRRRLSGLLVGRSRRVVEILVPTILEQMVATPAAQRSYAALVRRHGEPAPGPSGLLLPPAPELLASLPYWAFHPLGIERRRAEVIRAVCARAPRLEETATMESADARARLTAVAGVGPWTASIAAGVALGDPDAVVVGDFHLPHTVAWALAGERRASDERMLELLAPYAGQRGRAQRLLAVGCGRVPRRAPKRALRSIARL